MVKIRKQLLLLIIPILYTALNEYVVFRFLRVTIPPIISQILFCGYFFWTGMFFAEVRTNKLKSFIIGNSAWAIFFLLFIWQRILTTRMIPALAEYSQLYSSSFLWAGIKLSNLINMNISSNNVFLLAYISIFFVFLAGFVYTGNRKRQPQ